MLDSFVDTCRHAVTEANAASTIKKAVEALVASHESLAADHAAPTDCATISGHTDYVFEDESLTVCLVHTPPGMLQPPHDHSMTAIIGGYAGTEMHRMYRRTPQAAAAIEFTGDINVGPGDVLSIGTAGVHGIDAAPGQWSSAVHVYLGGLSAVTRSIFNPDTFEEHELSMQRYDEWCRPTAG